MVLWQRDSAKILQPNLRTCSLEFRAFRRPLQVPTYMVGKLPRWGPQLVIKGNIGASTTGIGLRVRTLNPEEQCW